MTAIAILYRDEILQSLASGKMLKTIAKDLQVTPMAISSQLNTDPEYKLAREVGAAYRLESTYEQIEGAETITDISRARECFRAASWFAEREFPHRWGRTDKLQVEHTGDLGERLRRAKERIVAPLSVAEQQQVVDAEVINKISD